MASHGERVVNAAMFLNEATPPEERAAVVELVDLLGPHRWIATSRRPPEFMAGAPLRSPSAKPSNAIWASRGDWLLHDHGGIQQYLALIETKPDANLCVVDSLDSLTAFVERHGVQSTPVFARPAHIPKRSPPPPSGLPPASPPLACSPPQVIAKWEGYRSVQLFNWADVAKAHAGFAMPVNLRDPEVDAGWEVAGYDVSSLAVWDPTACFAKDPVVWDLLADSECGPDHHWTVEHSVLPLLRAVLS